MFMQSGDDSERPGTARTMTPDELADLLARSYPIEGWSDLGSRPLLAVLDTSCVRTGLRHQLQNHSSPLSLSTARDGSVRLFIEYETLAETGRKLPKFAKDLGVSAVELARLFDEEWLPYITVVRLPAELRQVDQRAAEVCALDPDDYPAAALAAMLSPCVLLTHNFKDFGPLGMRSWSQGPDAILAGIDLHVGQLHLNAVVMVPAAPVVALGAAVKWASEKIGPWVWLILCLVVIGGILLYKKQPQERRETIKKAVGEAGGFFLKETTRAAAEVSIARAQLHACLVPPPGDRTWHSAMLRELAMSDESLSAQQLAELLDESVRPPVASLRAFLRANDNTLFYQVRRGGFVLGTHCRLRLVPRAS